MLRRFVFAVVLALFSVTVANADPLVLTTGSFNTFRSPSMGSNSGAASGPRVSFSGGSTSFDCGSLGCGPGDSGFLSSLNRGNAGNGGVLVIDGVTYNAFVIGFGFTDNTITGIINVYANRDVPIGTEPLFSMEFVGSGFATVFVFDPPNGRTFSTTFTITSVPEPASLFLIGIGVAGLAAKLRRRHT